jgi:hypothetical protein
MLSCHWGKDRLALDAVSGCGRSRRFGALAKVLDLCRLSHYSGSGPSNNSRPSLRFSSSRGDLLQEPTAALFLEAATIATDGDYMAVVKQRTISYVLIR